MKIVSIQGVRSSFSTRTGDYRTSECSKRTKRIIEMGYKFAYDLFGGIRSVHLSNGMGGPTVVRCANEHMYMEADEDTTFIPGQKESVKSSKVGENGEMSTR